MNWFYYQESISVGVCIDSLAPFLEFVRKSKGHRVALTTLHDDAHRLQGGHMLSRHLLLEAQVRSHVGQGRIAEQQFQQPDSASSPFAEPVSKRGTCNIIEKLQITKKFRRKLLLYHLTPASYRPVLNGYRPVLPYPDERCRRSRADGSESLAKQLPADTRPIPTEQPLGRIMEEGDPMQDCRNRFDRT